MIKEIAEHRTVRNYRPDSVPQEILDEILTAATRASTVGNMQMYSIVVSREKDKLAQLAPLHFNQPAVAAPVLLTFCADVSRFSRWCELRGAEPEYENLVWFMNAATDALLASQNAALEAEAHGLGICYLGTTLYNAGEIAEILKLPRGVIPIMTLSVGYPEVYPELTDRLPLDGVVHYEEYERYTNERLNDIWAEREATDETQKLLEINSLPNLARIFTDKRYTGADNRLFSEKYLTELRNKGFI